MATKKDLIKLVDIINDKTQDNELDWTRHEDTKHLTSSSMIVDSYYTTKYKDRILRIFECKYKDFVDDIDGDFHWAEEIKLEFIDEYGCHLWEFPRLSNTSQLMETIKYNEVDIDEFIDSVFEDVNEDE